MSRKKKSCTTIRIRTLLFLTPRLPSLGSAGDYTGILLLRDILRSILPVVAQELTVERAQVIAASLQEVLIDDIHILVVSFRNESLKIGNIQLFHPRTYPERLLDTFILKIERI